MSEPQNPLAVFEGGNGVKVEIFDRTSNYAYSNIHHVKLEVVAGFPATDERFTRTLEKMGVFDEELEQTKAELIGAFKTNGLQYLLRDGFGEKLAVRRDAQTAKRR